jgi:ppGpp synthetase/RelA/SpoT-type nucleotidyltranferase
MITPARLLNKYRAVEPYLEPLRVRVRESLLVLCEREGYALVSRVKALDSVCEKVETGRFACWADIDDLVAFTIVVPKLSDELNVLAFLQSTFSQVIIRKRGSLKKAPDAFRFDSTRFIGRLSAPEGQDAPLFNVPFEVQIRSAFEHAWSVTTHALTYKSPEVSWSKLRLTAQLKASVEQLDTLVAAFEDASKYIEPSDWPEIQAKIDIQAYFASKVSSGLLPIELTPKDWSRFVDNVYEITRAGLNRPHPSEVSGAIKRDLDAELATLGVGAVPMSISLGQLTYASLVKAGTVRNELYKRWPLVTPELEDLYPSLKLVTKRFDYS